MIVLSSVFATVSLAAFLHYFMDFNRTGVVRMVLAIVPYRKSIIEHSSAVLYTSKDLSYSWLSVKEQLSKDLSRFFHLSFNQI